MFRYYKKFFIYRQKVLIIFFNKFMLDDNSFITDRFLSVTNYKWILPTDIMIKKNKNKLIFINKIR